MRFSRVAIVLALVALAGACGKKESAGVSPPTASSEASVEARARATGAVSASARGVLPSPSIGGSFAMVGEFAVELAVHREGLVEARVTAPDGTLVTNAKLSVSASARSGASEPIVLAFVSSRARFEGHAQAGVELRTGPVEIKLELDDKVREGTIGLALALEPPRLGGSVFAAGAFGVEALALTSGDVFLLVRNGNGAAASADIDVEAKLTTRAGAIESVKLAFDPARALFVGKCSPSVQLVPGRFAVDIRAGGNVHSGALARVDLSTKVASDVSAKALLAAELGGAAVAGGALAAKAGADARAKLAADARAPSISAKVGVPDVGAKATAAANARITAPKVQVQAPKVAVDVKKSAKAGAGTGAKASAGFSFGSK